MGQATVLVVDDDPHVCRVTCYALRKAGYTAATAYSAEGALQAAAAAPPAVVVLDLALPDGDGCSVCARLKAGGEWPRVVILTGRSSPKDFQRATNAGADEYMTKPFSPSALIRTVRNLLDQPPAR